MKFLFPFDQDIFQLKHTNNINLSNAFQFIFSDIVLKIYKKHIEQPKIQIVKLIPQNFTVIREIPEVNSSSIPMDANFSFFVSTNVPLLLVLLGCTFPKS